MQKILPFLIFFFLILEGFGVNLGHESTLILTILLFPVLFVHMIFHKKKLVFPKIASIFFIIFLAFTLISTIISVNVAQSLQYFLYLVSLFFVFLLSYNFKNELEKPLTILIFASSILFTVYYLLLNFHLLNLFIPTSGYQFVFSRFGSHNHLGDFLVLSVVVSIYYLYNRKHYLLTISYWLLTIPLILFSYSRSAYLSIALTVIFMLIYLNKKHSWFRTWVLRIVILIIILATAFFVITITSQAQKQPLSSGVNRYLVQKENLQYKELLGDRLEYSHQAFLSFQKHPLLGVGPNNFYFISKLYSKNPTQTTEVAHNIFLEILVGQGILGFLPFVGLILLILLKSRKNALYFAMLAMLTNFQTDYTYQIYSFLLLFFVLAGTISSEK